MKGMVWGAGVMLSLGLALHALPYLVRDQVVIWLRSQGVEQAGLKALEVDWWRGEVRVRGLSARREGQAPLDLGLLQLDLDYNSLLDQQLRFRELRVQDLTSGYRLQGEVQWLGPIDLTYLLADNATEPAEAQDGQPSDWSVGLDSLALDRIDWTLMLDQTHHLQLDQLRLGTLYLWQPELETPLSFSGRVNGAPISLESVSVPLAPDKRGQLALKIEQLDLQSVAAPFVPALSGVLSTDLTLSVRLEGDNLTLMPKGTVELTDLGWDADPLSSQIPALAWSGAVDISLQGARPERITLAGELALPQGATLTQYSGMDLQSSRLAWQGDAELELAAEGELALSTASRLDGAGLQLVLSGDVPLDTRLQTLNWNGQLQLRQMTAEQGSLSVAGPQQLTAQALSLDLGGDAPLSAAVNSLDLKLGAFGLTLPAAGAEAMMLALTPTLNLQTVQFDQGANRQAALERLTFSGQINGEKLQQWQIKEGQLALDDLQLAESVAGGPLLALDHLQLNRLALDPQVLTVGRIDLTGLQSKVVLDEQMQAVDLVTLQRRIEQLGGAGETVTTSPAPAVPARDDGLRVRISEIAIGGDSRIRFNDRSTQPAFKSELAIESARISAIDTGSAKPSRFSLTGKINRFAELQTDGQLNLLGDTRSGEWAVQLTGLELPTVSPYSLKYTGYYLKSGQLSLDLHGTLEADQLEGQNKIRLHRLEVEPADQEKMDRFQERISMPLGTAVAVLQDKHDNIDLEVPISGSLDDPQFDYQSIINRVAGKGVKQGVMAFLSQALQPYGALITLAEKAIDASQTGAFISLQPVSFAAGSEALDPAQIGYLEQLTKLLHERSALRLNLCGLTVEVERPLLMQALEKENSERKEPLEAEALAQELEQRLEALANARAETLKAKLQAQVSAERLFMCYPQIDQAGEPRVDLAL